MPGYIKKNWQLILLRGYRDLIFVRPVEAKHPGGGGKLGLIFAGYVPLACLAVLFVHSQVKKGNPDS